MKSSAHAKLDTGMAEQVTPHMTSEHRVTVTHDGLRKPMKTNDLVEECSCHRRRRVGMAQCNEVGILRESVHHREQHTFAMHLGQSFDEVDGDVSRNTGGDRQRLEKTCRVQRLHFIPLARRGRTDEVANDAAVMLDVEALREALQGALDPFVPAHVRQLEHVVETGGRSRDVDTPLIQHEAITNGKGRIELTGCCGVAVLAQPAVGVQLVVDVVVELERQGRQCHEEGAGLQNVRQERYVAIPA